METITVDKRALKHLARLAEEINDRIESLELMQDKEFMESLRKSEEQIKNRDFANWDDL